jgi:hypothetical protein
MMSFLGAFLFALMFVMIAPQTRKLLLGLMAGAGATIASWAPFSYIVLAVLVLGPLVAMYLVHSWPRHVEPENPMAKYRREIPFEE